MTTVAELAKITVTPETQERWKNMVAALTEAFNQLAETLLAAAEQIAAAFESFRVSVGDVYPTSPARRPWPGSDPVFRRRGRGR